MLASECASPAVIVMLTQTHESGREKCHQYFPLSPSSPIQTLTPDPDIDDGFEGTITLESCEEDPASRSTVRKMRLRTRMVADGVDGQWQEKDVYHLLFSGWPDFLIPEGEDRLALTELIALSCRLNTATEAPQGTSFQLYAGADQDAPARVLGEGEREPAELNPRIVHCSAGVGRSGTFIALDYLLSLLAKGALDQVPAESDPVAETVDRLRQQRMMMVQGEGQFFFLYEVLREAWVRRWAEVNGRTEVQA